jgi:hypothetical protein
LSVDHWLKKQLEKFVVRQSKLKDNEQAMNTEQIREFFDKYKTIVDLIEYG